MHYDAHHQPTTTLRKLVCLWIKAIGANIRLFSMAAANLGCQTVNFGPVYENYERACQTIVKNGWQNRVHLLNWALTVTSEILNFDMGQASTNMAGIQVVAGSGQSTPKGKEGNNFAVGVLFDSVVDREAWKGTHVIAQD